MTVLQRLPVWLGDALPHEDKDGMTMNEEHSQAKNRAALVSLLAACLLTAIKLVVGIYTNWGSFLRHCTAGLTCWRRP